jgi:hypothetical protein
MRAGSTSLGGNDTTDQRPDDDQSKQLVIKKDQQTSRDLFA